MVVYFILIDTTSGLDMYFESGVELDIDLPKIDITCWLTMVYFCGWEFDQNDRSAKISKMVNVQPRLQN